MSAVYTTSLAFGAATKSDDATRLAIHDYTITVSQTDPADEEITDIRTTLGGLVAQLRGRQLDLMLPGTTPSPVGMARWVMEQLALNFPRLTAVTVIEDNDSVTVTREVQR